MNASNKEQIQNILEETKDDQALVKALKRWVFTADNGYSEARSSVAIADLAQESLAKLENTERFPFMKTGFPTYDQALGGLALGEFVVIGGRPGMGKTQWLIQLAMQVSQKHPVLHFSFDLAMNQIGYRMLSFLSGVQYGKMALNELSETEREKLAKAQAEMKQRQLFINDSGNNSISVFESICEQHIKELGVKLIVVDYLQMMETRRYSQRRELEISMVARALKNMARNHQVAVVASSQLSRSVETRGGDKRPMLSDLRESGAIEQEADKVLFMYRPAYYNIIYDEDGDSTQGIMELLVAKNRQGPQCDILFQHDEYFTRFDPYERPRSGFDFGNDLTHFNQPF